MTDTLTAFALLADRYCAWVDAAPASASEDEATARDLLPQLYIAAHRLPEGAAPKGAYPHSPVSEYESTRSRFRGMSVGYYGATFDPLVLPPEEPTVSDLADDLSDIYSDLLRGLELFRARSPAEAAWYWRFHFTVHWGAHLVGALRALHHSWSSANPPC